MILGRQQHFISGPSSDLVPIHIHFGFALGTNGYVGPLRLLLGH